MTRTTLDFAGAYTFRRAVAAPYVDASGATVTAPVDTPRFTHDPASPHAGLGLMIGTAADQGAPDMVSLTPAVTFDPGRHTVLHTWIDPTGATRRDARFTDDPRAMIDGLLRLKGTHAWRRAYPFLPTDIDAVVGDPPTLVRDGDTVTAIDRPGESWTVAEITRVTTTGATRVTTAGDIRTTGDTA